MDDGSGSLRASTRMLLFVAVIALVFGFALVLLRQDEPPLTVYNSGPVTTGSVLHFTFPDDAEGVKAVISRTDSKDGTVLVVQHGQSVAEDETLYHAHLPRSCASGKYRVTVTGENEHGAEIRRSNTITIKQASGRPVACDIGRPLQFVPAVDKRVC